MILEEPIQCGEGEFNGKGPAMTGHTREARIWEHDLEKCDGVGSAQDMVSGAVAGNGQVPADLLPERL
jgi:hypothetical protein